ncbi:MAG: hypothetical protein HY908_22630 [Myxococcales bacterium]|nr:hypothetical protein [Myxococcales bacterium]
MALVALGAALLAAACTAILGNDYAVGAGGGSGATSGGSAPGGSGGSAGQATGGGGSSTGGAQGFQCVDVTSPQYNCAVPDPAQCLCASCVHDGVCYDQAAGLVDDCICRDCAADPQCADGCNADGVCHPFLESCECPDCVAHPGCICHKCGEHLANPGPETPLCPGSDYETWANAFDCACQYCATNCSDYCTLLLPADLACQGCIDSLASQCGNFIGPCLAE